jgi:hypothetical protein
MTMAVPFVEFGDQAIRWRKDWLSKLIKWKL